MSDDPTSKPLKLKLQRPSEDQALEATKPKLKAPATGGSETQTESSGHGGSNETQAQSSGHGGSNETQAQSSGHRGGSETQTESSGHGETAKPTALPKLAPNKPATEDGIKAGEMTASLKTTAPPQTTATTPKALPKLAPKTPLPKDAIKAGEISTPPTATQTPRATPPPLRAPSPKPQQQAAPGLPPRPDELPAASQDTARSQSSAPDAVAQESLSARSSIGTSIALIIVLMLILGGGGYAVWELFMQPGTTAESAEVQSMQPPAEPQNPVERAQAVIEQVPLANSDAIRAQNPAPPTPAAPTAPTAPIAPAASAEQPIAIAEVEPTPTTEAAIEDLRSSVSKFLSTASIGMVRTGANARVMLNQQNYRIGDEVEASTGLIFKGTQNGKLVFKDRNEVTYHKSF